MRRRNLRNSFLLSAALGLTAAFVLLGIRYALEPTMPGLVVVATAEDPDRPDSSPQKIKRSDSYAFQRPSAPRQPPGGSANVVRAATFGDVPLPESGPESMLTEWIGSQDLGDFGEGVEIIGGAGGSTFFGIRRQANRFAFVVDVSGSMSEGSGGLLPSPVSRIEALRKQMHDSISAMPDTCQFAIVFFNEGYWGVDGNQGISGGKGSGRIDWIQATDENKFKALKCIENMSPGGGTEWIGALSEAVKLDPRPEVLYLLSDGEPSDWKDVKQRMAFLAASGIAIDTVALECDPGGASRLRELALKTGGSYRRIERGKVTDRIDTAGVAPVIPELPGP
ncbi:VonWillebr and factor A domain-containing protein 3A isoform X1 [Haloferula helveola]|uniref:vonWillebr and factor A domain-containing protein 3A isoform X1 n=1 Tax=Haloferula helveola TaxID=490095 RepID=A0ABN6H005_9BACT|nr:VonWillebr and factor A domain-containing protein 3A isoform X1 [Haloferula helveola]